MDNNQQKTKSSSFFSIIKNVFFLLLFLQFAPMIFMNIKKHITDLAVSKSEVGQLTMSGLIVDSSFYVKKMQKFLKDPDIKALFLKIDVSGGTPGASQALFNEIKLFKKEKPVIVYVENVCASGGYYIASAADHIVSTPSALVGSIGVVLNLGNIKHLLEDWKIKMGYIQSGKYKTAGSPLKDATPEELAYLQKLSDGNYDQFVDDIAQARKLDKAKYKEWADGKVFLGTDAKKLNLVDEIGSFTNAKEAIKKLANIEDEIKFIKPKRSSGLARLLMGEDENDSSDYEFSSSIVSFLHSVYTKFFEKESEIKIS